MVKEGTAHFTCTSELETEATKHKKEAAQPSTRLNGGPPKPAAGPPISPDRSPEPGSAKALCKSESTFAFGDRARFPPSLISLTNFHVLDGATGVGVQGRSE